MQSLTMTLSAIITAFIAASIALGLVSATPKETGIIIEYLGKPVYFIQRPF